LGFDVDAELEKKLMETPVCVAEDKTSRVRAVWGGAHNQFLVPRRLPADCSLANPVCIKADRRQRFQSPVDDLVYCSFSTLEPFTFHVGNRLDEWTNREIDRLGLKNAVVSSGDQRVRSLPASTSHMKQRALSVLDESPACLRSISLSGGSITCFLSFMLNNEMAKRIFIAADHGSGIDLLPPV